MAQVRTRRFQVLLFTGRARRAQHSGWRNSERTTARRRSSRQSSSCVFLACRTDGPARAQPAWWEMKPRARTMGRSAALWGESSACMLVTVRLRCSEEEHSIAGRSRDWTTAWGWYFKRECTRPGPTFAGVTAQIRGGNTDARSQCTAASLPTTRRAGMPEGNSMKEDSGDGFGMSVAVDAKTRAPHRCSAYSVARTFAWVNAQSRASPRKPPRRHYTGRTGAGSVGKM